MRVSTDLRLQVISEEMRLKEAIDMLRVTWKGRKKKLTPQQDGYPGPQEGLFACAFVGH